MTKAVANKTMPLDTLENQMKFSDMLLKNKILSESFKTPSQVLIGLQYCLSVNIPPMVGLREMYIISGRPCLYGKGPISICRASGKLEWLREYFVDDKGKEISPKNGNLQAEAYAAVCEVKRKGTTMPHEDFFTVKDMQKARLTGPVWQKYQRIMLRHRARGMALQSAFPDVLNGMEIAEYHYDALPEEGVGDILETEVLKSLDEHDKEYDKKEELIGYIKETSGKICEGKPVTDKITFMKEVLEVQDIDDLKKESIETLEGLLEKLTKMRE